LQVYVSLINKRFTGLIIIDGGTGTEKNTGKGKKENKFYGSK